MGGPSFDRQVFVKKQTKERPPSRSLLPGAFVLLLVAALASFATYRYVKARSKVAPSPADAATIKQLQTKLKQTEARVQELQKGRHAVHSAKQLSADAKAPRATAVPDGTHAVIAEAATRPVAAGATPVRRSSGRSIENSSSAKTAAASDKAHQPDSAQIATLLKAQLASSQAASNKKLDALQNSLTANHQDWQATTNRLGSVVGEVDSQRNAIQKTQTNINYLLERAHRSDVSFTLKKGERFQRVGPISMRLSATSVKGQHYTIRMVVDDKTVELKDRALNEVVEFYTSRSKYPLRLIVSQIAKGQVSGTLAVPYALGQEADNPQMHELQQR